MEVYSESERFLVSNFECMGYAGQDSKGSMMSAWDEMYLKIQGKKPFGAD